MIQDISPQKLHIEYEQTEPNGESQILCFDNREVLVKTEDGELCFPAYREFKDSALSHMPLIYLFCVDEKAFFLTMPEAKPYEEETRDPAEADENRESDSTRVREIPGYHFEDIQLFRTATPRFKCFAGITGHHLYEWYRSHLFCGRCQRKLERDAKERMLFCQCGNQLFPKICPAVIAGVTNGDYLLMTRYARSSYKHYSLVAGFIEIGENAEDAVKREVMEEAGLRVKNIRYYKSQPWGLTESLLFGFFAELDGDPHITVDTTELAEAKWIHRDEIQVDNDGFSLTNEMICSFRDGGA